MESITLHTYGRKTVHSAWNINPEHVLGRLYYVNSGEALIRNASCEHRLLKGNIYIIPQCHNFMPLDAVSFDHTFFDFYSSRTLDPNKIIEIDASLFSANLLFDYINTLIEHDLERKNHNAMEHFLSELLSVIDRQYFPLPYITNQAVQHALDIIHKEPHAITTRLLAQKLNMNESHIIRLFHRTMGMSPMKYIRSCRVLKGKELILGGASVAEAAEKCGYSSPTAFCKAVKVCLSQPPSKLKSNNKN